MNKEIRWYLGDKKPYPTHLPPPPIKTNNNVSHPNHYTQGGIECKDAIASAVINLKGFEAYATGNIIKYLWRWKAKNGVEDLNKAKQYIDFLIEHLSKENEDGLFKSYNGRISSKEKKNI